MDLLNHILLGAQVLFTPINIFFCFLGVLMGTLVGVLPGLGPTAAIALLLPNTFHVSPVTAIIMLAGIYYGAMYGGSTTSILVNIPGEAASVITCLDGYQMARKGRAGVALGIAAFGSFIAGTISVIGLMLVAPPLAKFALAFGPPEYFSLMLMGIVILIYLASGSILKALMMAVFGLLLGTIGMDSISATQRLTFGLLELSDGVGLIPAIMGLFGVAEVIANVEQEIKREVIATKIKNLLPNLQDWKDSFWPMIRGGVLGFFIGILPGPAPVISAFSSYAIEKKLSKHPEKFGTGHDPGGGRARSGQQCRYRRGLYPPVHPRDPGEFRDRHPVRGLHDPRHSARAHADRQISRSFLGHDHEHVPRECHAPGFKPAPDRVMG